MIWARSGCGTWRHPSASTSSASAAPAGFSGAALARSDAQQPAAAGHLVHRTRTRTLGGESPAGDDAALTLLGMGGLGKTRLSLQIGADVLEKYPDGVWFVDLAPIKDASLVVERGRAGPGRAGRGRQTDAPTLCAYVREHKLLLIIDNCEHLIGACASLADALLQAAPGVRIIATSREALHIRGEQTYPVLPLRVPDRKRARSKPAAIRCRAIVRGTRTVAKTRLLGVGARTHRRWPSCAPGSTAFRWRWSWRPRECDRCRSKTSTRACTIGSSCSPAAAALRWNDSRRCARWSTGRTTCCRKTSRSCSTG